MNCLFYVSRLCKKSLTVGDRTRNILLQGNFASKLPTVVDQRINWTTFDGRQWENLKTKGGGEKRKNNIRSELCTFLIRLKSRWVWLVAKCHWVRLVPLPSSQPVGKETLEQSHLQHSSVPAAIDDRRHRGRSNRLIDRRPWWPLARAWTVDDRPGELFCNLACDKWKSLLNETAITYFRVLVKSSNFSCTSILSSFALLGKLAARLSVL